MNTMNQVVNQGERKWNHAAFRISGDALRPDQISASLGLEATQSGLKGERFSSRHNAVRRTSFWLLKAPLDNHRPLEEHLKWLLDTLEPKYDSLIPLTNKWKTEFFCGFSSENGQGGATFDPVLLDRLAHLGIPLVLDLYPPGVPPDVQEEVHLADRDAL